MMTERQDPQSIAPDVYTRDYYFEVVNGYEQLGSGTVPKRFLDAIDFADLRTGMRILDIGCGRGELVLACAERGCLALGIDYSASAIDVAKEIMASDNTRSAHRGVEFERMDARELRYQDGFFDCVFMIDVAEHIRPEELHEVFDELRRVIRPGGKIIIRSDPNKWLIEPIYFLVENLFGWQRHPYHVNLPSYTGMRRHVKDFGGKGRVFLEKVDKFFLRGIGKSDVPHWVSLVASMVDRVLDSRVARFVITHSPLILLFGTNLWAVIHVGEDHSPMEGRENEPKLPREVAS